MSAIVNPPALASAVPARRSSSLRFKLLIAGALPLVVPVVWVGTAVAQGCSAG